MKMFNVICAFVLVTLVGCTNLKENKPIEMKQEESNLMCDPEIGMCEISSNNEISTKYVVSVNLSSKIKVIYFTDPICSSCWAVEGELRKLKLEYGENIEIEYHMGGLLPDWSYNSGGISSPKDVAAHWDEVSEIYDMPIDGDLWLEDPLSSSYPPSIAFKAAQLQDANKALLFLRKMREYVFLEKKNITKWEYISSAANHVGLDTNRIKDDMQKNGIIDFKNDLNLSAKMRVRGFPTFFFQNKDNQHEILYGARSYEEFEKVLLKLHPEIQKADYIKSEKFLFDHFETLTAKEFSILMEIKRLDAGLYLEELCKTGDLDKVTTKNGNLYFKHK